MYLCHKKNFVYPEHFYVMLYWDAPIFMWLEMNIPFLLKSEFIQECKFRLLLALGKIICKIRGEKKKENPEPWDWGFKE